MSADGVKEGVASSGRRRSSVDLIASGSLNLINVKGVKGEFCDLSTGFDRHKADPSQYPMFRDLVKVAGCSGRRVHEVDLAEAVRASRAWDAERGIAPGVPKGFIFHESRCGSTLAANALVVSDPGHRVYSER